MADKQPEALRLADRIDDAEPNFYVESSIQIDRKLCGLVNDATQVLRRQHALIAELVDLLKDAASQARPADYDWPLCLSRAVDAAIAKAEEAA